MEEEVQMLEITSPRGTGHRMPVDFTTYLLSSSPPASSLELLTYAFHPDDRHYGHPHDKRIGHSDGELYHQSRLPSLSQRRNNAPLKPIIIKPETNSDTSASTSGSSTPTSPRSASPHSPGRLKKKVSFADHQGKALATVRVMTEASDMPPRIRPEVLASVTQGASAAVTEQPPLKLCFNQPASDYLAFRDRLEKEFVSLENVILRDYRVGGTVKVKNVTFHKNVFVRVTFDSWETFEDTKASFVPSPADHSVYDTFSFEFNVPTNFDMGKVIEFAVCYEADESQFWDSNSGNNYHIVSADYKKVQQPKFVSHSIWPEHNSNWSEYACWNHVDTTTPYW
ncbi:protein phosphatase 1 regulatory subunit 3B-like isoform X1 [Haliotis cracherodii]|uniref:protein phosphatase 1 regulatory subunit 3B-like isoform X1 n=2 Tax=Haliotis cracherodii TaxID=6455 RepID=UPI0039EABF10